MMDNNKTPWLPFPPSETAENVAALIIKEYRDFTYENITEEKLMTLLYLCTRDAFNVTGCPVTEESFFLDKTGKISLEKQLPPLHILKNTDPVINNENTERVIKKTLPNYTKTENWVLRKKLSSLYNKVENIENKKEKLIAGGISSFRSLPKHKLTLMEIWQDSLENKPYDYYFNCYFSDDY